MDVHVSRDYLDRARISSSGAEEACKNYDWALSILRSAECVEFCLKATVRLVASSHKRQHDVSGDLVNVYGQFPEWFKEKVPRMNVISRTLTAMSIPAKYGDEILNASPRKLFDRVEAEAYISIAKQIYYDCDRLFYEIKLQST